MQNLLNELNQFKLNISKLEMRYITRTKKTNGNHEYLSYTVPISSEIIRRISNPLLSTLIDYLKNKILVDFNPTGFEVGTIEYIPNESINNYQRIHDAIANPINENIEELDFSDIWGYSIKLSFKDDNLNPNEIILFRKFSFPKLLDSKKTHLLSFNNGAYNILDNDIVSIDNESHCFTINDNMYILNKSQFETFFNFSSTYSHIVQNSFNELNNLNIIDNFDGFIDKCLASDTLTRRLVKIINENRFETVQNCMQNVPNVIDGFGLNIRFENDKIIFDNNSSVNDMITLVRGACVIGALDNEPYLASDTKRKNIS